LHPLPPTVERQDSGLPSIKSGLPQCGISIRPKSAQGQNEKSPPSALCQLRPTADIAPLQNRVHSVKILRGDSYFRLPLTPRRRLRRWRRFRQKGCRPLPASAPPAPPTTCRLEPQECPAPRGPLQWPAMTRPASMARTVLTMLPHAPKNHLVFVLSRTGFAHNRASICQNAWKLSS
jgi:hypothetical protein